MWVERAFESGVKYEMSDWEVGNQSGPAANTGVGATADFFVLIFFGGQN